MTGCRYEADLEDALERSYKQYLERKGHRDDVAKVRGPLGGMRVRCESARAASAPPATGAGSQTVRQPRSQPHGALFSEGAAGVLV